MRPWCLENPTVRSPFRLREGLIALSKSSLQGNLRGREQEVAFRDLLGELGVVSLGSDATFSVSRKWRKALNRRGFLYPPVSKTSTVTQGEIGPLDTITANGWRLINADSVPAMQECFLRSLAAYYIPSDFEKEYEFGAFSPLRHTLAVMLELEKSTGENHLNFIEMAVIIQNSTSADDMAGIVAKILDLRDRRQKSGNKKQFDGQELEKTAKLDDYVPQTFNDYADTNFRYLKATGLVQSKGRGIALVPEKHVFIEKLVETVQVPESDKMFYTFLCNGATLPTDNKDSALVVLEDLLIQLSTYGITFDTTGKSLETPADIGSVRHEIEAILSARREEEYAAKQAGQWEEIAAYMDLLIHRRSRSKKILSGGAEIEIPQAEAPAYFEWVLWRAFLAVNSLVNKPYEARRFKIDQDFLPVGTAPGNGPDLIFEFDEFVLVVEVTLTDNSRQEAAEGEPVRRHVARIVEGYPGKRVYGLFIANKVDTNTVETLRIGFWYKSDDSKMALQIVPITLEQFQKIFSAGFSSGTITPKLIQEFLRDCLAVSNNDAPAWKREIERTVQEQIAAFV
ncbi:AlwI family type II restriction endonuclease [Undibacterium sp. MH2W]|uniref:AlwI family type II restriction endonuclease n=1 Tax=Undibacterium sp. MH2W TaxID=3413044 RepID=UPI003BF332B7